MHITKQGQTKVEPTKKMLTIVNMCSVVCSPHGDALSPSSVQLTHIHVSLKNIFFISKWLSLLVSFPPRPHLTPEHAILIPMPVVCCPIWTRLHSLQDNNYQGLCSLFHLFVLQLQHNFLPFFPHLVLLSPNFWFIQLQLVMQGVV